MWFKVDDRITFHRKVFAAGNEAMGAWMRAGAWSSAPENLTEGYIPPEICAAIAPPEVWARLRAAGLTEAPSGGRPGEQIHDYLDYNPSAEEVRADREGWRIRQKRSRESRQMSRRDIPRDPPSDSGRDSPVGHGGVTPVPIPIPIPYPIQDQTHTLPACAREEAPPVVVLDGVTGEPIASPPAPEQPRPTPDGESSPAPPLEPDLLALAEQLEREGSGLGKAVRERAARLWSPTPKQLAALREIAAERAALPLARASAGQRAPPRGRSTAQQCPASDEGLFKGKVY